MPSFAPRDRPRVLIVGQGAPGGIGRVEQLVTEAAVHADEGFASESLAVWRRTHPGYLRDGTALEYAPTVPVQEGASMATFARRVGNSIRSFRPDHIMYMHIGLARLAPFLAAAGHPKSYSVWTYGVEVWEPRSVLHRHALVKAERVLAISTHTAAATIELQGVPEARVDIVPLCLPESAFSAPRQSGAPSPGRLLTVSRLDATESGKNLDALIIAMPEIRQTHPGAHLVVVGEGDLRGELERLAVDSGVADAVEFTGRLSDEALEREYRLADLFVLPSEKEGFGLVFIEAMLRDTPVVGFSAGGTVDVIRDGEDGALISDLGELSSTIVGLLSDRERLEAIRSQTRERVEVAFSPTRFRRDLRDLVQ